MALAGALIASLASPGGWTPGVPPAEAVGSITIGSATYLGGSSFSIQGNWDPSGNQCWGPGNEFHHLIEIYDDPDGQLPVTGTLLSTVNPAPCNGDYTDPVAPSDRGLGGVWPGPGQGGNTFTLGPGVHRVCAILRHVSLSGNDIAASTCFAQGIAVFVVAKDFVPNSTASAQVSLNCTQGNVSPATGNASEAAGAAFGLVGVTGSETCTATETQVPEGYTSTGPCSAPVSAGGCTIVNVASETAVPTPTASPTTVPSAVPPIGDSPGTEPTRTPDLPAPSVTPAAGGASPAPTAPMPPAAPVDQPSNPPAPGIVPPSAGTGGLLPSNSGG